ncbi:Transposon protein [Phytophthora megakarya]|uniref:Transposon protein n=1 Tax=Phytophthora megakarya TaxID=4795 RepID=A0A225V3G3_9STRA|nr:Transposon protein [Phytophthora megakarya]
MTIYVQQDNASPNISPGDKDVVREGQCDGWNIVLICQPPNSPNLNYLDLGTYVRTTMELIEVVQASFKELDIDTLDNIFITLQQVMECLLKCEGGNEYKLPHMRKAKLRREGRFPDSLILASSLYEEASSLELSPFAVSAVPTTSAAEDNDVSFVQPLEKRRRLAEQEQTYVLLKSIPSTSNIVERFFGVARVIFGQERNSLQPLTLE